MLKISIQLVIITLFFFFISCSQKSEYEKLQDLFSTNYFIAIPKSLSNHDRLNLYNELKPSEKYNYWQFRYVEALLETTTVLMEEGSYRGDKSNLDSIDFVTGFFHECEPMFCYTYILAQSKNKLDTIGTKEKFRLFIGQIDNLSEAILVGNSHDFWIDSENKEGGSYKETENEFLLKLLHFESIPHTWYSVRCIVDKKTGNFILVDKYKYKSENVWSFH